MLARTPKKTKAVVSIKLDLGCGARRPDPRQFGDGWTGIDIAEGIGADKVLDLTRYPWPYKDSSVDAIYTSHFFEHLSGTERIPFMEECWRILKIGDLQKPDSPKMTIIVPYWSSMRSIQDPFHKWPPVCEMSFLYFNKNWMVQNKLEHYGIKCDFDFAYGYVLNPAIQPRNAEYQMAAVQDHVNSVMDLSVTLAKRPKEKPSHL